MDEIENETFMIETTRLPKNHIICSDELQVFLIRHFNIYDSLYYSNFLTVKFKLWYEEGYKKLNQLIVSAGIPLLEAKQKVQYMKTQHKRTMFLNLKEAAEKLNLSSLTISSFLCQLEDDMHYSAFDILHLLTTVIDYPHSIQNVLEKDFSNNEDTDKTKKQIIYDRICHSEDNFWSVYYDLLNQ